MAQTNQLTKLRRKLLTAAFISLVISACSTPPSSVFQRQSVNLGLTESSIDTPLFELAVFDNGKQSANSELHVYLEGDGIPFIQNRFINIDPTSTKATTLALISQDDAHSILVGRPCYHGKFSASCSDNKWWTSHRYSTEVVEAIAGAINAYNQNGDKVVLIGFSGGGALAMLMADKINGLKKLVTINANLDIDAWTNYHSYTPLSGSLNPIKSSIENQDIRQLHLLGERDKNVPHSHWADKIKGNNSSVLSYPNFGHHCCWSSAWPQILTIIKDL
jgi:pimeloyl-ACP methyl ester carboxylesterase